MYFLKERNTDVTGGSGVGSDTSEEDDRRSFFHLREHMNKMFIMNSFSGTLNITGAPCEFSEGNEKHVIGH